ncbi:hypothetical protein Dimus_007863 [Dionaea muscipula]
MCQLKWENGVWWLEIGGIRRRDDEDEIPAENDQNVEGAEEEQNQEFDWEAVIDEVEIEGEDVNKNEKFFDVEDEVPGDADVVEEVPDVPVQASAQQKETTAVGVDPSIPTSRIPDFVFMSQQAKFERARADRIYADLERAQAENARLLALIQQPQTQDKP